MSNREPFFGSDALLIVAVIAVLAPIGLGIWWAVTGYPWAVQLVGLGALCWVALVAVVLAARYLRSGFLR